MSIDVESRPPLQRQEDSFIEREGVTRKPILSFEAIAQLLPVIDLAIILAASLLGVAIVAEFYLPAAASSLTSLYGLALVASGLYVFRMRDFNHYEPHALRAGGVELRQIAQTWALCVIVLVTLIYMFKLGQINTRRVFVAFALLAFAGLVAWRAVVKYGLRRAIDANVIGRRNVLLIGEREELQALDFERLLGHFGLAGAARFPISGGDGPLTEEDRLVIEKAIGYARETNAEEAMVAATWGDRTRLGQLRRELRKLPLSARLLPDARMRSMLSFPSVAHDQLLQVELQRAPLSAYERGVKRAMDVSLAALALLLLSPLMALAALAIKLESPGPAVFRQRRIGFNRREFTIYKFRTMRVQEDGDIVRQATRGDERVTRLGRFLRASSIDELPQLWNVLRGEMSLVGPRPHATVHDHEFEEGLAEYAFRRHVKPGITGWAQCNGRRGPTPTVEEVRQRVDLDLWYITNWSVRLDLYILLRTILVVLGQRNAL